MFERALCATEARAARHELDLGVVEVDAVGEQRALVERARAREPRDDAQAVARERVALVGGVLGRVDVQAGAELPAAAAQAASVSSESVNEACAPTMPRVSGGRSRRHALEEARGSRRSRPRARSGPSRSVVS